MKFGIFFWEVGGGAEYVASSAQKNQRRKLPDLESFGVCFERT